MAYSDVRDLLAPHRIGSGLVSPGLRCLCCGVNSLGDRSDATLRGSDPCLSWPSVSEHNPFGRSPGIRGYSVISDIPYGTKADVRGRAIRGVWGSSRHAVSIAIRTMTEIRTALHHLRRSLGRPDRIQGRCRCVKGRMEPIAAPFPRVTGYTEESIVIRRKSVRRADAREAIFSGVSVRKIPLPDVAQVLPFGS